MDLGGVGWDRMEFLESNLHMCDRDDTKIVVYSLGRCTRKEDGRKKSRDFFDKTMNSCKAVEKQDNITQAPLTCV